MTTDAGLLFFAPYLNNTAAAVVGKQEIPGHPVLVIAELLVPLTHVVAVGRGAVDLRQPFVVGGALGEAVKQGASADVVDLAQTSDVLGVEVAHIAIGKEIVAIDMVYPYILGSFLVPSEADASNDKAAD